MTAPTTTSGTDFSTSLALGLRMEIARSGILEDDLRYRMWPHEPVGYLSAELDYPGLLTIGTYTRVCEELEIDPVQFMRDAIRV